MLIVPLLGGIVSCWVCDAWTKDDYVVKGEELIFFAAERVLGSITCPIWVSFKFICWSWNRNSVLLELLVEIASV